jgi:aarF domain-containing kinase
MFQVFKEELADECDYTREAKYMRKYHDMDSTKLDSRYKVPWVWDGSTEQVLVMERMHGFSVGGNGVNALSQDDRNQVL